MSGNTDGDGVPTPPRSDAFTEQDILSEEAAMTDGPIWLYDKAEDRILKVLDWREIYKWHYALVLGEADGTYVKTEDFHDSSPWFQLYIPEFDDE